MKILVTGREGQLARSLAQRLAGHELVFAARPEVDLARAGSVASAIRETRPDWVVNAAAYTAVDQAETDEESAFRINAEAAGEAAAAAHEVGAPIIQVSTDYVFDGTAARPYREGDPTAPRSAYGRSKLAGEEAVRAAGPRHLILRTAWVYSPFGRNFVKTMLAAATRRDELTVVGDQRGNPTSALDLADAIRSAIASDDGALDGRWGTYHVAGTGEASWFEFATRVMEEASARGLPAARVRPIRTAEWPTPAPRPANSTLDTDRFALSFGFRMPPWQASLADTVAQLARAPDAQRSL